MIGVGCLAGITPLSCKVKRQDKDRCSAKDFENACRGSGFDKIESEVYWTFDSASAAMQGEWDGKL